MTWALQFSEDWGGAWAGTRGLQFWGVSLCSRRLRGALLGGAWGHEATSGGWVFSFLAGCWGHPAIPQTGTGEHWEIL